MAATILLRGLSKLLGSPVLVEHFVEIQLDEWKDEVNLVSPGIEGDDIHDIVMALYVDDTEYILLHFQLVIVQPLFQYFPCKNTLWKLVIVIMCVRRILTLVVA